MVGGVSLAPAPVRPRGHQSRFRCRTLGCCKRTSAQRQLEGSGPAGGCGGVLSPVSTWPGILQLAVLCWDTSGRSESTGNEPSGAPLQASVVPLLSSPHVQCF